MSSEPATSSARERYRQDAIDKVMAYADQFAELANQVKSWMLEDQDVVVISMTRDGTLIGSTDGRPDIVVSKDVAPAPSAALERSQP